MPTTYAGYAPRREGDKGTLDIGKAFGGAIETIETAQKEEKERREKLTSIYDKNKQTIEGYATGKSKGFNNWMQEQITKVAGIIAADFKLLKQGKTTDSDYRRKNSNINSSWSMLAKRAKGWNDHYAAGLKQVNSGKGSDYMAFMLGEDSKISDFAALDMFIQDDGNLVLSGIDDNGVVVPGSERALTTIMSPENSVDASLDAPAELQAMLKTLPEYSIIGADGKKIIDPKLNRDFNAQRLLNAESVLKTDRDIAKWYSNLNEHKVKYFSNPNDRFSMVDTYMKSDVGINAVANRAKDLHADKVASGIAGYSMAQARTDAEMEIEGEQHLLQVLSADDGNTTITQPQFGERGTFKIPSAIDGGRPITIMVEKINPETGEVDTEPKTFQPGEEVNLGEMQYHKVKAQIYKQQSVRSGHKELGGRAQPGRRLTPAQLLKIQERKELRTSYYTTGRKYAHGIDLDELERDSKEIIKAELREDFYNPDTKTFDTALVLTTKEGDVPLFYGDKGADAVGKALQPYIQTGADLSEQDIAWKEGKKLTLTAEKDKPWAPTDAKKTTTTRFASAITAPDISEWVTDDKGKQVQKLKYNVNVKLDDILTDTGDDGEDHLKMILTDLSNAPGRDMDFTGWKFERSEEEKTKTGEENDYYADWLWVTLPSGKVVKFKMDKDALATPTNRTALRQKIEEMLTDYHGGAQDDLNPDN